MADKTSIEWTDATWNPIRGCTRVSEGCRNCYAERVAARFSDPGQAYEGLAKRTPSGPRWTGKVITVPGHLEDPLHWKEPRMIFVNSMSDMYHESLAFDRLLPMIEVMDKAHWHIYQILTKRADRQREFFNEFLKRRAPANWWLGTSVEDQTTANKRIPDLLNTWASVRWISAEPLLGRIDFMEEQPDGMPSFSWLEGFTGCEPEIPPLSWVVVGGESGPGARPMHPNWVRSIRDDCRDAGVPFFFKQWGEWVPCIPEFEDLIPKMREHTYVGDQYMMRVGKKNAGRILDGREWNEYPGSLSAAAEKRIVEAACH